MFTSCSFAIARFRQTGWAIAGTTAIAAGFALAAGALAAVPGDGSGANPIAMPPIEAFPGGGPALVVDSEIHNRVERAAGLVVAGQKLRGALLRQFYAAHNFDQVWATRQSQVDALVNLVSRAGEHGLDPDRFHLALLRNRAALAPIDRDLILSDAFLGYADALARGAVPIELRMDDEDLTPEPVDVASVLGQAVASADPAAIIEALAPRSPAYTALRRALQSYRAAAAGPESARIAPASHGQRDLRAGPDKTPDKAADKTADKTNESRLRDIAVNLERLRWLPRQIPADRVWVNTANAQLVLYRDDRPVFTTRVVVGEVDKQTPELQTTITSLLFNPPWNVPYSIATKEILPKAAQDPNYLTRHRMVVRPNGAIQQLPGPGAALGQLKFELTNRFDVYLHDTPLKALFNRDNRRQSHGCVRVQNPRELAALLLQQPVDTINKGIAIGSTNRRMLPAPVPVFLVYQTVFLDADGTLAFRPDEYGRDDDIWRHLSRSGQAPVAQNNPAGQRRS